MRKSVMHQGGLGLPADATPEQETEEIHRIFMETFSTESGRKCLNILLSDLMYFDVCHTETEQALSNYGKFMVNDRLGAIDTISMSDLMVDMVQNESIKE